MITQDLQQNTQPISPKEDDLGYTSTSEKLNNLSKDGWLQIVLPGNELSFERKATPQLLQTLKAVGRKDLSLGRIYEGHINALFLIHLFATQPQKEKWFSDAQEGCLFGVWNTGTAEPITIHLKDDNGFVLQGKKTFASGTGLVKRALVTGNLNSDGKSGWQMCIVNSDQLSGDAIDYHSWKPMGMKDSLSYTVDFTGYKGMTRELTGNKDDYYKQPYFSAGAIRFCAVQLGGAEALFNHTIEFLKSLGRTDDVFQQTRIAEMTTALTAGDLWIQQAAVNWDNWVEDPSKNKQLITFANMTRTAVEQTCLRVIELSSKCIGARGLQQPNQMERIVRDLQFYLRQPAPDAALVDVAKYVIQSQQNIEALWHEDKRME